MVMRFASSFFLVAALAAAAVFSCNGGGSGEDAGVKPPEDTGGIAEGEEGGPCFGNGTCNAGLVCASDLCVKVPDAGTETDGGTGTDTGTETDTGVQTDAGVDVGVDTGMDTGTVVDAGADAGFDAGPPDTGGLDTGFPQAFPREGKGCVGFGFDPQSPQISDPLQFGTQGKLVGKGMFTQAGFKPPDTTDCNNPDDTSYVEYTIPQAECGRVEFDVAGLDGTLACKKAEEILGMYDRSWVHPGSQNALDAYQFNPYKVSLLLLCDDPGAACSPVWVGGWLHVGNDLVAGATGCKAFAAMKPFTLAPGQPQRFVVQWSGDDQQTCLAIEGTGSSTGGYNCVPRATCGEYVSYIQTITIGGTPLGPTAGGATFSNVKIWWVQPE
jgi:hypothetical protein